MRNFLAIALTCGFLVGSACGEIPARTLSRLKAATVLVNASGRYSSSSGSGFVIISKGKTAYIVTNAHTTAFRGKPAHSVSVVFNSGQPNEKSVDCKVLARDRGRDLAILKATIASPPRPIALPSKDTKLRETMDIHMIGFPFGRMLALNGGNPAVTIGKGVVSSLRKNRNGELLAIQIDGDINPGNSGGPVVTRTGELIGISVAKIRNTGIGLAIPVSHLRRMLAGSVQAAHFKEGDPKNGKTPFEVTVELLDPMQKIKRVALLIVPKRRLPDGMKPKAGGSWGPIPKATTYNLKLADDTAADTITLPASPKSKLCYWMQVRFIDTNGKAHYTEPRKIYVSADKPIGTVEPDDTQPRDPGDDWLGGTDVNGATLAKGKKIVPNLVGRVLAGKKTKLNGAIATEVRLSGLTLTEDMVWVPDGTAFVVAEKKGILRKVATTSLKQTRELDLRSVCGTMSPSAEGIALLMPARQEVWVIDPARLDVLRRISVPHLKAMATARGSSLAVVACMSRVRSKVGSVSVIDLKTGKTSRQYRITDLNFSRDKKNFRAHASSEAIAAVDLMAMTPDGKTLLVVDKGCIHRFAVKGSLIVYNAIGPKIVPRGQSRIEISQDSRYAAVLSAAGNTKVGDHPDIGKYGTYVYAVSNLQQPIMCLQQGPHPQTLAFDKKRRVLYGQNNSAQGLAFETNGRVQKKWQLTDAGATRRLVMSTDGSRMLMLTESSLFRLDLVEKPTPRTPGKP